MELTMRNYAMIGLIVLLCMIQVNSFVPVMPVRFNLKTIGSREGGSSSFQIKSRRSKSFIQNIDIISAQPKGENQQVKEILAGFVTALATIPTSISYSLVVGVKPLLGIWNSAILGLSSGLIGGAPGLIIGSAGVTAVPMAKIFHNLGPEYMFVSLLFAGLLELFFGIFKLTKYANIITTPVISGFLNALGLFILSSQLKVFQVAKNVWLPFDLLLPNLSIAGFSAFSIFFLGKVFPRLPIPSSLIGIVFGSFAAKVLHLPVKSLADFVGKQNFQGGWSTLPTLLSFPTNLHLNEHTIIAILSTAFGVAIVSILETIIANRVAYQNYQEKNALTIRKNDMNDFNHNDYDKTVAALGLGNIVAGFFGGYGGCGLIPNTILNNKSGGSTRLSSLSYGISIAAIVVLLSKTLGLIPIAALSGLMIVVALNTIEWKEGLKLLRSSSTSLQSLLDLLGMIATTYVSYKIDMGLGVVVGVLLTQLLPILKFMKQIIFPIDSQTSSSL